MGSKTRLSSYCTKRANNGVNFVTSRKINTRRARPIMKTYRSMLLTYTKRERNLSDVFPFLGIRWQTYGRVTGALQAPMLPIASDTILYTCRDTRPIY